MSHHLATGQEGMCFGSVLYLSFVRWEERAHVYFWYTSSECVFLNTRILAHIAFKAHIFWPGEDAANVCFDGLWGEKRGLRRGVLLHLLHPPLNARALDVLYCNVFGKLRIQGSKEEYNTRYMLKSCTVMFCEDVELRGGVQGVRVGLWCIIGVLCFLFRWKYKAEKRKGQYSAFKNS